MIIQKKFPLSRILWYKIGGKAKYLLEAKNTEDIKEALEFIRQNKIQKVVVLGLGSNLIFSDEYFDGVVIRIVSAHLMPAYNDNKSIEDKFSKKVLVKVFAGKILDNLIRYSFSNNLIGLEWAGGLPGTVGGGIRGNAGAFGKEISDNIISVDVLERKNGEYEQKTLKKSDLHFSYRSSLIKENKNLIIISATFQLQLVDLKDLARAKNIYRNNIAYREKHHPLDYPSCGSVFKNITEANHIQKIISVWPDIKELAETRWHGKVSMGFVIERLGFSGYKAGNMQISKKHANFIVNLGGGKAADFLGIIKEIQNKVRKTFGFTPEVEVEIVTNK